MESKDWEWFSDGNNPELKFGMEGTAIPENILEGVVNFSFHGHTFGVVSDITSVTLHC